MKVAIKWATAISAVLFAFTALAWGQGRRGRGAVAAERGKDVTASYSFDVAAVRRGKSEFTTACASCHGTDARGGNGNNASLDLVRSVIVLDDVGGTHLGGFLKYGRPEKGMPKFDLTAAQVSDIAAFLHYSVAKVAERNAYPYQDILVGDAKAGEAYFNGAGGCNQCHSVTGDLKGIASKYAPPALQNRMISGGGSSGRRFGAPAGPSPTDKTVTITLAPGKTVSGTLVSYNDYIVTIRDVSGASRSFFRTGDSPKVVIKNPLEAHVRLGRTLSDRDMHNLTAYLETLK